MSPASRATSLLLILALAACTQSRARSKRGRWRDAAVGPTFVGAAADGGAAPGPIYEETLEDETGEPADAGYDAEPSACPADMVLVDGMYCPIVEQVCLEHHPEWEKDHSVSERCLRFREPTRCVSKHRDHLRYCVDRYEWPNERDAIPLTLVDWYDASDRCESVGKRLCTVEEFNFACEGEAMQPYAYGFRRDDSRCNIDRRYRLRDKELKKHDECMDDPECKAEMDMLDQRVPAGSKENCVSPFGVHDMNGNVDEWVSIPGRTQPNRSGLKSGWWGPVRDQCRPTVTFHKENDWGYEIGFRCCREALDVP